MPPIIETKKTPVNETQVTQNPSNKFDLCFRIGMLGATAGSTLLLAGCDRYGQGNDPLSYVTKREEVERVRRTRDAEERGENSSHSDETETPTRAIAPESAPTNPPESALRPGEMSVVVETGQTLRSILGEHFEDEETLRAAIKYTVDRNDNIENANQIFAGELIVIPITPSILENYR